MTTAETVFRAGTLATDSHYGQVDRSGIPYIEHVKRVAGVVRGDNTAEAVAWLHDIVEDTPITVRDIREAFGDEIANAVDALSRRDGETYYEFGTRVIESGPLAVKVKLADVLDNLGRVSGLDEPERSSLGRRYIRLATRLLAAQGVTP